MHYNPFREEILPKIQSESPLGQLKAITSQPTIIAQSAMQLVSLSHYPPQRGWVAKVTLAMRRKRMDGAFMFKYLVTTPPGDLHSPGRARGKFPEHPSHSFTALDRTGH